MVDNNNKFETKNVKECLDILGTSESKGLSFEEAENRLKTYGYNKLQEKKKKSIFKIFIEQFKDLLVFILIGSSILSFVSNNIESAVVIWIVLILNTTLSTIQYVKAQQSL